MRNPSLREHGNTSDTFLAAAWEAERERRKHDPAPEYEPTPEDYEEMYRHFREQEATR